LFYPIPETKNPDSTNVPVGLPIPESDVLVLGDDEEPCEPGEIGAVVILSQWLARGYLNGEQVPDPRFCTLEHNGKQRRAYRTGDLGRWLSDGNLELMGRKDRQVKIRGYRIELDEIESILSTHTGLSDISVIELNNTNNNNGDSHAVIACCFTSTEPSVNEKDVRSFAKDRLLPQVLSLTRFRRLDQFPLMPNGKVDRHKLQSLFGPDEDHVTERLSDDFRSDGQTVQQRISAMWEDLLALEAINLEANFFELGGDSMTAIRLLRRLREELHPEVKLDDVYENPSIAQLSSRVEQLLA
jgi:acyl-coenzyme A synthetase/AMP-(fatty) acid ligase/acyl carrier protein